MISSVLLAYERNLDYARRLTADIPAERLAEQPAPGMNHPAWVLGHLAATADLAASLVGMTEPILAPELAPKFGHGSQPVADPAAYPGRDELIAALERNHDRLAGAVAALSAEDFARPMPIERMRGRFPTVGDALVFLMTAHEAIHLGQLSAWRRALGLPSV